MYDPQENKPIGPLVLTTKEAADRLRVSVAHVREEIQAGRLHCVTFGKATRRIPVAELDRYLAEAGKDD